MDGIEAGSGEKRGTRHSGREPLVPLRTRDPWWSNKGWSMIHSLGGMFWSGKGWL